MGITIIAIIIVLSIAYQYAQKDKKNKNGNYSADPSEMRKAPGYENAVPGVNSPEIAPPAFNPPVPRRYGARRIYFLL